MAVATEETWTCDLVPNCPLEKFSTSSKLHRTDYHSLQRSIQYAGETVLIRRLGGQDGKLECPCGEPKHARYNYQKISNMCSLRTGHPSADETKYNDWTEDTYSQRPRRIRTKSTTPAGSNSDSTTSTSPPPTSKRKSDEQPSSSRNIRPKLQSNDIIECVPNTDKLAVLKKESDRLDKKLEKKKKKEEAEIRDLESQIEDLKAEIDAKRQQINAYRFRE
ncbi:hypothetical protein BDP27DRAFT_1463390 [Rhodocollybia butyracea]|uniref:Uncharacterized protein n=1 Tax=Rhodocollybia butyracea TaxID=206335 RepID=A0A9P5PP35_9AGAR|nr:hypothetical protein BDP27DRAFT_1463390 [Rhodocollybia butyracea]